MALPEVPVDGSQFVVRRMPDILNSGEALEDALHVQLQEMANGGFQGFQFDYPEFVTSEDVLIAYRQSTLHQQHVNDYRRRLRTKEMRREQVDAKFIGDMFEGVAYGLLLPRIRIQGDMLLSPKHTREFYRKLYPESSVSGEDIVGTGVSNPDGIRIGREGGRLQIIDIYDYTTGKLSWDDRHLSRTYAGFTRHKRDFRLFDPSARFILVTPKHQNGLPDFNTGREEADPDIVVEQLPMLTHDQFGNFTDRVMRDTKR